MNIDVSPVDLQDILQMRDLYRQEMNCQIVHDSHHQRGFIRPYLLEIDGRVAGYGCVGDYDTKGKEVIKEFYVLPGHRASALPLLWALIAASHATRIQAQTNDTFLTLLLYDCAQDIASETVLFHDAGTPCLSVPDVVFRKVQEKDKERLFEHKVEPEGDWMLEQDGVIAATGGFLCHYNPPYGDIFMEVAEPYRRRGYGSYLVQELKRVCYESGRRPAARCSVSNIASRKTLQKAGFLPCARILTGRISSESNDG